MKIEVTNRQNVENFGISMTPGLDFVVVSISCPGDRAEFTIGKGCLAILRLEFDDIDAPATVLGGHKYKPFGRGHAVQLVEFFRKWFIRAHYLIVHCDAGLSRSPAVAAAFTKMQGHDDLDYFKKYIPNRRVYSMILSEFYTNGG